MLCNLFSSKLSLQWSIGISGSLITSSCWKKGVNHSRDFTIDYNIHWLCPHWILDPHFMDSYDLFGLIIIGWVPTYTYFRLVYHIIGSLWRSFEILWSFIFVLQCNGIFRHHQYSMESMFSYVATYLFIQYRG